MVAQPAPPAETAGAPYVRARESAEGGPTLYREIARNGLAATGARLVNLALLEPGDTLLRGHAWAAAPRSLVEFGLSLARRIVPAFAPERLDFPVDVNPLVRAVHLERRPVLATFEEMARGSTDPRVLGIAARLVGLRHTYSVPFDAGGGRVGSLAFHFAETPDEQRRLTAEAFARQAGLSLENALLSAELAERFAEVARSRERIVEAEERTRREIAELLHDRVQAQLLIATQRVLDARRQLDTDVGIAGAELDRAVSDLDHIREEEVRRASHVLHPEAIRVGLVAALQILAERYEPALAVTVAATPEVAELDDPRANRLPEPLRLAAYRVVEQALANVARHARASSARIGLAISDASGKRLAVSVRDDGQGFDGNRATPGMGLRTARDRVELLRGSLHVESVTGRGTTLTASFPLD